MSVSERSRVSVVITSVAIDGHFTVVVPAWDRHVPLKLEEDAVPPTLRPRKNDLPKLVMARVTLSAPTARQVRVSDVEANLFFTGPPEVTAGSVIEAQEAPRWGRAWEQSAG